MDEVIVQLRFAAASNPLVVQQEVLALGSNTLAEVRDAVYCVVDCSAEYYGQGS